MMIATLNTWCLWRLTKRVFKFQSAKLKSMVFDRCLGVHFFDGFVFPSTQRLRFMTKKFSFCLGFFWSGNGRMCALSAFIWAFMTFVAHDLANNSAVKLASCAVESRENATGHLPSRFHRPAGAWPNSPTGAELFLHASSRATLCMRHLLFRLNASAEADTVSPLIVTISWTERCLHTQAETAARSWPERLTCSFAKHCTNFLKSSASQRTNKCCFGGLERRSSLLSKALRFSCGPMPSRWTSPRALTTRFNGQTLLATYKRVLRSENAKFWKKNVFLSFFGRTLFW